jgi:hypothetical protein
MWLYAEANLVVICPLSTPSLGQHWKYTDKPKDAEFDWQEVIHDQYSVVMD